MLCALVLDRVTLNTTQLEVNGAKSKQHLQMISRSSRNLQPLILVNRTCSLLLEIALHVNTAKSKAIVLENDCQSFAPLQLGESTLIPVSLPGEKNRYLGTTITDQPAFDHEKMIQSLTDSMEKLARNNLLHSDQKLNIINQFMWPQLIYSLQTAPLNTFPNGRLQGVDQVVRSTVKEIVQLPADTPNSFFYAPRKFKGLGLMNAEWKASLPHINICFALEKDGNPLVFGVRNLRAEIDCCTKSSQFYPTKSQSSQIKTASRLIRWRSYEKRNENRKNGSHHRTDIIAIDRGSGKGFILDPTIRFETSLELPHDVDTEKKSIYEPTIAFYRERIGIQDWEVIGLLIGARGTVTTFFENFRKRFQLAADLPNRSLSLS
ncbi:hypothetical protein BV898_00075 [Hypsibius exemplaris]|uniref:Uncharacterized protein n=1 Tax=Hypsibius exemplaris TaxID=2072580 RepID=A0A1W0XEN7_HYPEX|nr:hypothetical protein BV898_00075 [Hypsibius exemplaris]